MSKKSCCKTVHLTHEENQLLEVLAAAEGKSCSEFLHDALIARLDEQKSKFMMIANALGFERTSRFDGSRSHDRDSDHPRFSFTHY